LLALIANIEETVVAADPTLEKVIPPLFDTWRRLVPSEMTTVESVA
jgi:hypothetical protein